MISEGRATRRLGVEDLIIVALGGNLAASPAALGQTLERAILALPEHGLHVVGRSRLWRSSAWPRASEPAFLNGVALVETALDPVRTLAALHAVETLFGRRRGGTNAPRTLDLDLIAYGRHVCAGPPTLPHPRAAERLFVMGPLAELVPDWPHPLSGERAVDLAARASVGLDAAPQAEGP